MIPSHAISPSLTSNPYRIYDKYGRTYLLEIKYWYINIPKDLPYDQLPPMEDAKFVVDAYHAGNVRRCP